MTNDDIPGIRPDKARVVCNNCGHEFESRGNPCRQFPNTSAPARCPDCPVNGAVHFNQFSYVSGTTGDIRVEEK